MISTALILWSIIIFLAIGLALKTRYVDTGIGTPETRIVRESDNPVLFWVLIALYSAIALLAFGLALLVLI